MRLRRERLPACALPLLAAIAVLGAGGREALAVAPSDPNAPASEDEPSVRGSADNAENGDAGAGLGAATPAPGPTVVLAGGANGSLASIGEAWTTWRYGRSKGHAPVDETTSRVRISGSGRALDGLIVGFSVGLLAPSLHVGAYASTTSVAAVWARHDRVEVIPDVEWDTSVADAGPSSLSLTVTAIDELSHGSERHGGFTLDVTRFRVHGTLDVTLPCTRSTATFRRSCQPATIHGAF